MNILFEQASTILMLGVLAEAIAIGGLLKTGRKEVLLAAVVIPLIVIALLGLERYVVTDREEVRDTLHAIARAVESNDLPELLQHLSEEMPAARQQAEGEMPRYRFSSVDIKSNLKIEVFPKNIPPKATANFNVTVVVSDARGMFSNIKQPRYVELKFYKEEGAWKVGEYAHFDALQGM